MSALVLSLEELYGDFEDLETGVVHTSQAAEQDEAEVWRATQQEQDCWSCRITQTSLNKVSSTQKQVKFSALLYW